MEDERIDLDDPAAIDHWVEKLDTTESQLRDAVAAVGPKVADVELHLKGSRSTSNSDRVHDQL